MTVLTAAPLAPILAGLLALTLPWGRLSWTMACLGLAVGAGPLAVSAWREPTFAVAVPALILVIALLCVFSGFPKPAAKDPLASVRIGLLAIAGGVAAWAAPSSEIALVAALPPVTLGLSAALAALATEGDRRAAPSAFALGVLAMLAGAAALAAAALLAAGYPRSGTMLAAGALIASTGLAPVHGSLAEGAARAGAAAGPIVGIVLRLASFAALLKLWSTTPEPEQLSLVFLGIGALSVLAGAAQAAAADELRSLASHVFTVQLGCALLLLSSGGAGGMGPAMFVAVQGALVSLALSVGAGEGGALSRLDGLGRARPFAALIIAIGALAVAAAPMTGSFLALWMTLEAAIARGWHIIGALVVLATFAAVFVAGQLLERIYFRPAGEAGTELRTLAAVPALGAAGALALILGWQAAGALAYADIIGRSLAPP